MRVTHEGLGWELTLFICCFVDLDLWVEIFYEKKGATG